MLKELQQGLSMRKISKSWMLEGGLGHLKDVISWISVIITSHLRRTTNKVAYKLANKGISWELEVLDNIWQPKYEIIVFARCYALSKADFDPSNEHSPGHSPNIPVHIPSEWITERTSFLSFCLIIIEIAWM